MKTIYKCFPKGKNKVLTMSYDDGRESDIRLIKLFNKYGIKGTFHLNSGLIKNDDFELGDATEINDEYGIRLPKNVIRKIYVGQEVAAHTATHSMIERCPMTQVVQEVIEDRKELERIVGYTVRGFSYPYGSFNDEIKNILPSLGIEYARAVKTTGNFNMPKDFFEWEGTCRHIDPNLLTYADEFVALNKNQNLYMFYVWGHSYEFDRDDNWNIIEEFCKKIANKDDIWYASNIEIVDYLKAYDSLKFSADGSFVYNPSVKSVWINMNNEKVYEVTGGTQVYLD